MADQRTMAELLRAPTEGYAEAILVSPILAEHFELKHSLINRITSDHKSANQQTSAVTTAMTAILKQFQATSPLASVKAIEKICITCGAAHPYYQCLAVDGNTFLEFQDNIQGYVSVAAVNYNQGPLPNNTISNPKGELKAITTRSNLVLDRPFVPMPLPFINPEEDEPVSLKKLPEKLEDPRKFLISCCFSELKCKDLADLDLFATNHLSGNPTFSSHTDLTSPEVINPLSGNTTSSSPDHLIEEFADELALITFPPGNDDLPFDIKSDLREIEYFLNCDPTKEMDSILEESVDEGNLADPNNDLVDTIPEMFTDEHTLDYSSPTLYDDVDDHLVKLESDDDDVYDDPFDSKKDKIKESKLLIVKLDPPRLSDFLPSPECDSVLNEDFFEVDAFPSTNNEDKVFNPGILIHENLFKVNIRVTPDKNVKKISISNASLILEDFNPPLYELPFHKEVPGSKTLLSFSSKNEEKVFNPGILTSKGVHTSLLLELSHRGPKAFKVIKIFESPMEIFPCFCGKDIRILDVPCLHFYPP
uniref:Reverse transcriptase domain-containing protein, chloroplastic n=1 Tax=Tanacetum cinerariifolium TaxID=118510 RepID=A0A6L2N3V5_TANCI|nr:reverse transcriptase domain-containing protein, chloroplastic [Tanacetum cinerariifolium]